MMISTKGRYALRVMIELAQRRGEGYVSLKEVARNQDSSENYLEAMLKNLVAAGLAVGLRGKGGGYRLAKAAEACSAAEILRAAEGSLAPVACLEEGAEPCQRRDSCPSLPLWQELETVVADFLEHYSLEKLVRQSRDAAR